MKFVTNSDDSIEDVTTTGSVSQPAALEKEGCVFEGWFTDASCTNDFDFSAPVTQDVTLYAKWTEKKPDTPVIDPEPKPEPELIGRVGDLDGDGFVTSTDALTALRISVESEEADDVLMLLADVDGDGYVTSGDAFAILRYSVELSSSENILKEIYK